MADFTEYNEKVPTPNDALNIDDHQLHQHLVAESNTSSVNATTKFPVGDSVQKLSFEGTTRDFHLHVPPSYTAEKSLPLVVVLHGYAMDADDVAKMSGMNAEADKENFVVAYPEAVKWNGSKNTAAWDMGNGLIPYGEKADDSNFLRKVVDDCQSQLSIDKNRTFLVGFSDGGMEAYKAASDLSDKFAAVTAVSGAMSGFESTPKSPVSILSIVGTSDNAIPISGFTRQQESMQSPSAVANPATMAMLTEIVREKNGPKAPVPNAKEVMQFALDTRFVPEFKPLSYATDFWKSADHITASGVSITHDGVRTVSYKNNQSAIAVQEEYVAGADHMIQHGAPSTFKLSANIWSFLRAHPKSDKLND